MEKQFVTSEIAKGLQKIGFYEPCLAYFNIDPSLKKPAFNLVQPFSHEWCLPAPLWQQAVEFLKDKYGYRLVLDGCSTDSHYYTIYTRGNWVWKTYTLERAIAKVIELIQSS